MALITPAKSGATAAEITEAQLKGGKADIAGLIMVVVLLFCTLLTLLILGILLTEVISDAWPIVSDRPGDFLTETIGSDPASTGVWPGLYGSFVIGLGVLLLAVPVGVAAAIYLEDYARHDHKLTQIILVNIRNLAGVPAVIYGVLGLTIFGSWLKGLTGGSSVISAALTMAILVLPVVIITSMEAIRAVPQGLREGGYGVGSSRWEVTRDHVIPYAAPGILTGVVLSIARALGEAAPLIMLGAITGLLPEPSLTGNFTALPMLIYNWSGRPSTGGGEVGWTNAAAAAGLVLLVLVIMFNAIAIYLRNRFERTRAGV
jgi:phosphate transport system permease protein